MSSGPSLAMEDAIEQVQKPVITNPSDWEESYRPLPYVFFALLIMWLVLVFVWTLNTWIKRRWQVGLRNRSRNPRAGWDDSLKSSQS